MNYWQAQSVDHEPLHRQIGPLHLWVERTPLEWRLAVRRARDPENLAADDSISRPTAPREWERFSVGDESHTLRLLPIMPDRPVVVRPESPLTITGGSECLFYVLIPCWIRMVVGDGDGRVLTEVPSVVLSNSWFGEPDEGVLCYAMRTTARRTQEELPQRHHQAFCPIVIRNTDRHHLHFSRLCLRVAPLSIYAAGDRLWTNRIRLRHLGQEELSEIEYSDGPPPECPTGSVLISPARESSQSWISWARLRGITSLVR